MKKYWKYWIKSKNNMQKQNKTPEQLADEIIALMTEAGFTPDEMLGVLQNVRMRLNLNYYSNRNK